jgi:hypothetical protein
MCFSAEASFTAAAVLMPAGIYAVCRACTTDRRYVALSAFPFLFGLQQLSDGLVWTAGRQGQLNLVQLYSLVYMFFTWLIWPIWAPLSTYLLESERRKFPYFLLALAGSALGAAQYFPYLFHDSWLSVRFLDYAIVYGGTELLSDIFGREIIYALYIFLVVLPFLMSSQKRVRPFGVLVAAVAVSTYLFFRFAYISAFCFGGAVVSVYLVFLSSRLTRHDGRRETWVDLRAAPQRRLPAPRSVTPN